MLLLQGLPEVLQVKPAPWGGGGKGGHGECLVSHGDNYCQLFQRAKARWHVTFPRKWAEGDSRILHAAHLTYGGAEPAPSWRDLYFPN